MAEWDFDDRRVWRYSTGGRPVELARQMLSLLSAEQPAPEDLTTLSAIVTHASLTNWKTALDSKQDRLKSNRTRVRGRLCCSSQGTLRPSAYRRRSHSCGPLGWATPTR